MLSFHAHLQVFVATAPCDLRMSFNGLWNAAQQRLGEDPKSGALFVFGNRRRNRIKLLYFDGTGVCVLAKRIEAGTVHWPQSAGEPGAKPRLAPQLLDGVDLKAGARNAVVLTLVANCRMHGMDPHEYFKDVLERLPQMTNQDDLTALMPRRWQQAA